MQSTTQPAVHSQRAARVHGGGTFDLLQAHGLTAADILDFSVNTNPYGPSPSVVAAAQSAAFDRYPDPQGAPLKYRIAAADGVSPDRIVVGNGAADLLWTLARSIVGPQTPVLIVEPTFCEFRAACARLTTHVVEWRATAAQDFAVDLAAVAKVARAQEAQVVYLCTPNSPTGYYTPLSAVAAFAAEMPQVTIVLDEAFLALSHHAADAQLVLPENVVRVRSLTKEHTIPGLRIGYLQASPTLASRIEANRPAWTINAIAEAAAMAALEQGSFVAASRERIWQDQAALTEGLRQLGLAPLPSATLFMLVAIPEAAALQERLLRHGILVRDCSSYGLPAYIRLCSRPWPDAARLIHALQQELRTC